MDRMFLVEEDWEKPPAKSRKTKCSACCLNFRVPVLNKSVIDSCQ